MLGVVGGVYAGGDGDCDIGAYAGGDGDWDGGVGGP